MALSQNEDFAIWYLRTSFLNNCKDGIGERLINVNSSILNTPGFRAAGWVPDNIQRTHSPPIPTAITTEYFRVNSSLERQESRDDEYDEGGLVTGRRSNDTVGPSINVKRRRRKEQIEDDDSSDLSDESEEDAETTQRAAAQIKFAKMPARERAGSSPLKDSSIPEGPNVMVTSPSKPSDVTRRRNGSLGAVEAVKARARADTTTSSDLSSENEIDPSYFQRRQMPARKPTKPMLLTDVLKAEEDSNAVVTGGTNQDDSDAESVDSAISSELGQTIDTASLLDTIEDPKLGFTSPMLGGVGGSGSRHSPESPRKTRTIPLLQELPPPRPISVIQPISLLSQELKRQNTSSNPIQRFAALSGKGSPNPLWIKIYAPFSESPEESFEMPLERFSKDAEPVIVAEAIGLGLWRYVEEGRKPTLKPEQLDVNKWVMRMIEDGEVEYDFPALTRTKPMTDFTSNNNRGARGRSRGKPFDEFALVEASVREMEANKRDTPMFSPTKEEVAATTKTATATDEHGNSARPGLPVTKVSSRTNPLLAGQPFASALSNMGLTPADRPVQAATTSTPRMGTLKTVRVRYFDLDMAGQTTKVEMSTDSYIAEILDQVCRRWNLNKAGFVLKVAGTNTLAPLDRTVEVLGTRSDLDLVRKRFGPGPSNLTGSPGSASPNAPLLLDIQGPTSKKGKKGQKMLHPLAQKQDIMQSATNFKKYYVTRRQLTSFTQNSNRVLVFDGDFLHNMPADTGKTMIDSNAKTNMFAFANIERCKVSSKHSKLIRLVVRRGEESKRYDFEARSAGEAQEIVDEITKEMRLAQG